MKQKISSSPLSLRCIVLFLFLFLPFLSCKKNCGDGIGGGGYASALFQAPPTFLTLSYVRSSKKFQIERRRVSFHQNLGRIIKNHDNIITRRTTTTTSSSSSSSSLHATTTTTTKTKAPKTTTVKFINPLLDAGYPPTISEHIQNKLSCKPLLLYVPGFDGTNVAPFLQYPELGTIFDIRCMTVSMKDRSTFEELRDGIVKYLEEMILLQMEMEKEKEEKNNKEEKQNVKAEGSTNDGSFLSNLFGGGGGTKDKKAPPSSSKKAEMRPIYIMGESFGGILALEAALSLVSSSSSASSLSKSKQQKQIDLYQNLKGLVLINPATCYDRSILSSKGPSVSNLPPLLYPIGVLSLMPLFTDEYALKQLGLILSSKALPSVIDTAEREAYMGRTAFTLPFRLQYMPQKTLQWRLEEWLRKGCDDVSLKLKEFLSSNNDNNNADRKQSRRKERKLPPVLVVAGEKDGTLPSIAEAERLLGILPDCTVHVVEGAGHACTCGSRVDLAALFRARFKKLRRQYNKEGGKEEEEEGRIAMKEVAANGEGIYFGMEPRYDDSTTVGLSPLEYWSEKYYRKLE